MAIQMAPLAGIALRYGAVAIATYAAMRVMRPGPLDQRAEDAMDDVPEGLTLRHARGQANAAARWSRTMRVGPQGQGVKIDATGLFRVKLSRVR